MTAALTKPREGKAKAKADDLDTRTTAARERVTVLRAERARAALAGERFDHASLRDAEDELAALGDAADERVRRERATVAEAEAERVARLRREIGDLEDQRRGAIEEAEALCRGMVDAMARAEQARSEVAARLSQIGARMPSDLDRPSQALRLSRGLCAVMTKLSGYHGGGRWGVLHLSPAWTKSADAWLAGEKAMTEQVKAEAEKAQ